MVMPVVEQAEDLALGGVAHVKLLAAHRVGLQANAKQLGFEGVDEVSLVVLLRKDFI